MISLTAWQLLRNPVTSRLKVVQERFPKKKKGMEHCLHGIVYQAGSTSQLNKQGKERSNIQGKQQSKK